MQLGKAIIATILTVVIIGAALIMGSSPSDYKQSWNPDIKLQAPSSVFGESSVSLVFQSNKYPRETVDWIIGFGDRLEVDTKNHNLTDRSTLVLLSDDLQNAYMVQFVQQHTQLYRAEDVGKGEIKYVPISNDNLFRVRMYPLFPRKLEATPDDIIKFLDKK